MIKPNTKLTGTSDRPFFRCADCADDRLHAGGLTTADAHYAAVHPGLPVRVELQVLGQAANYNPSPNKEDVRKGKR